MYFKAKMQAGLQEWALVSVFFAMFSNLFELTVRVFMNV